MTPEQSAAIRDTWKQADVFFKRNGLPRPFRLPADTLRFIASIPDDIRVVKAKRRCS